MPQEPNDWVTVNPSSNKEPNDWVTIPPPEQSKSLFQKYNESWINQPVLNQLKVNNTQIFDPKAAANYYDDPNQRTEDQWKIPSWVPGIGGGTYRSLGAGLLEGAGNVVGGLTTPLNLATIGAFKGATAVGEAAPTVSKGLQLIGQGLSAPIAAEGVAKTYQGAKQGNLSDVGFGIAEAAGGLSGMQPHAPTSTHESIPTEPTVPEQPVQPPSQPTESIPGADRFSKIWQLVKEQGMSPKDATAKVLADEQAQPSVQTGPDIISLKGLRAEQIDALKAQGYKPGGIGPDGYAQLARESVPPVQPPPEQMSNQSASPQGQAVWTNLRNQLGHDPSEAEIEQASQPNDISNLRQQSQVQNIDQAGQTQEPIDLGPQPTMASFDPNNEPSSEKIKGGGLKMSTDTKRATRNITKDYSSPVESIMVREGMQNALDAAEKLGENGQIRVRILDANSTKNKGPATIEIHDNGAGMDETTLGDKLTTLFASGKENEEGAVGGKGIGSASYIMGGQRFDIETVAVDSTNGKKYRIRAGGTPDQFESDLGSDWEKTPVPQDTPTGTSIKVHLTPEQNSYQSKHMMDNIVEHTRDRKSSVIYDNFGAIRNNGKPVSELQTVPDLVHETQFPPTSQDKIVSDFNYKDSDIKVQIPPYDPNDMRDRINVHYLNNGMYQFSRHMSLPESVADVPGNVLVNINPKVDEMHDNYPFINTREDVKNNFRDVIDKEIKEKISGPAVERRKNRTQELYDSMTELPIKGTERKPVIYDPGNRFTPEEMDYFASHPVIQQLVRHYDRLVDSILNSVGKEAWSERLEGVGLVLDPNINGIHIPNPSTGQSSILINPFARMEAGFTPEDNAWANTITNLHEVAHISDDAGEPIRFTKEDLADPRVGKLFQTYLNQLIDHGDVGFARTGHGMGFTHRLGETFAQFGVENTFNAASGLEKLFTGRNQSGGYSPEFQELLQLYQESRGREATTEDLLSGTGVKQANKGPRGEGNIPSTDPADGDRPSIAREAYNYFRSSPMAVMHLSAPLRQGLPMVTRAEWWKSWIPQVKAFGSEEAFNKNQADIMSRPLFQPTRDPVSGRLVGKSFADEAGLKMSDTSTHREETIGSNWIETGKMFGSDNPVQKTYQTTVGRAAKASNRAYTAFLNNLRADSFESILKDAFTDFQAGHTDARNPYADMTYAKEIADYVNTATGAGPLRTGLPTLGKEGLELKEYSLEQNARLMSNIFFAPKLMASRIRMLNPTTYMMASPFVRKQYLKSLIGVAGAWGTVATLAKGAGADVSLDPNSSDFGKIKIGNTRLDPAGGFQQYLVAASRLLSGHDISSASDTNFELGQGYRSPTRLTIAQNFMANKLHPVVRFAYDIFNASTHQPFSVGDRTLQMFTPIVVNDAIDLAREDPSFLPLTIPITMGMGSQTYGERGLSEPRIVPPEADYQFTGGELPGAKWLTGR